MKVSDHVAEYPLRISALPRLAFCTGSMGLPRVNEFRTTLPKPVPGTSFVYGAEYGTYVHKLVEDGKLEHPWRSDGKHEVRVAYSYQPLPDGATYWTDENRASLPYFTGTADFLGYDRAANPIVGDVKTSETIEVKQFIQLGGYAAALALPVVSLQIWRIRNHRWKLARLHKDLHIFKPANKMVQRAKETMDRAIRIKLGLEEPTITPGDHCGFCPSRFHCEGYDTYVESKAGAHNLYRFLIREQQVYAAVSEDLTIDPIAYAQTLKEQSRNSKPCDPNE